MSEVIRVPILDHKSDVLVPEFFERSHIDEEVKHLFKNGVARSVFLVIPNSVHIWQKKGKGIFAKPEIYSDMISLPASEKGPKVGRHKGRVELFSEPKKGRVRVVVIDSIKKDREIKEYWVKTKDFVEHPIKGSQRHEQNQNHNNLIIQSNWMTGDVNSISSNAFDFNGGNPGITYGQRMTAFFGLISGPLGMETAMASYEAARKKGDVRGMKLAVIRFVRGIVEATGGSVSGTARVLALSAAHSAAKAMQIARQVLGFASFGIGTLSYSLIATSTIINLVQAVKVKKELTQILKEQGEKAAFDYLLNLLSINEKDLTACKKVIGFDSPNQLYNLVTRPVTLSEEERQVLTKDDKKLIAKTVMESLSKLDKEAYPLIKDWIGVKVNLMGHLAKAIAKRKLVKKTEYLRAAGNESYVMLEKELQKPREKRIYSEEMARNVLQTVQKEAKNNIISCSLVIFATFIGIAGMIIATIFTGGIPLYVALAVMLASTLILTVFDVKGLVAELEKTKELSRRDKILLGFLLLLTITSTALGIIFSGGGSALVTAIIVGAVMLAIQGGAFAYIWKKQREVEEKKNQGYQELQEEVGAEEELDEEVFLELHSHSE